MITNEEVLPRVGETEAKLLKTIIKRKMAFFGHIARASASQELKTIIEGNDKKTGKGRRRTWWIDDIKQVTGRRKLEKKSSLQRTGTTVRCWLDQILEEIKSIGETNDRHRS